MGVDGLILRGDDVESWSPGGPEEEFQVVHVELRLGVPWNATRITNGLQMHGRFFPPVHDQYCVCF